VEEEGVVGVRVGVVTTTEVQGFAKDFTGVEENPDTQRPT